MAPVRRGGAVTDLDGRWHSVAGTFDGTSGKLFVDGRLIPGSSDRQYGASGPLTGDLGLGTYNDN